jgi:aminopeptidase
LLAEQFDARIFPGLIFVKDIPMTDPRISRLAQVMVHYSLDIKPGQKFAVSSTPLAEELVYAVYRLAVEAGAHLYTEISLPLLQEIFMKQASDEQLDFVSPIDDLVVKDFDAVLNIRAAANTKNLSGIDPQRIARFRRAHAGLSKIFHERAARQEVRWCVTQYPSFSAAQDAEMGLEDYQDFVFGAGMLNEADPVAFWKAEGERQRAMCAWLKGRDRVSLKGENIDLMFSIRDRLFVESDGKYNFPDGEIFTGPVEDSANGWVRFSYPAIYGGQEASDIELWFEGGKVVKEKAGKNQELLTKMLDIDAGSRFLGEWGIGTNYGIERFTKNMLFDEKIGGTIHLALGSGYPETGSKNESGLHWDMLCDMAHSEIHVDGELFYRDGKPVDGAQG